MVFWGLEISDSIHWGQTLALRIGMVIGLKGVRDTQGFDRFDLGCFAASVRHGDEVMGVCEKNRSRF